MKHIAVFFLIGLLCVAALAACGKKENPPSSSVAVTEPTTETPTEPDPATPEGAMTGLLKSAKEWDAEAINEFLPEGSVVAGYVPAGFEGTVSSLLSRTEYEVYDAEIDGDTAAVELELTAVDAEKALQDAAAGLIAEITISQFKGQAVDYSALIGETVKGIDIDSLPTVTKTATAHMVLGEDGEWKLDANNEANLPLLNAATGGAVDMAKELTEMAETYGIKLG
jgi:predicted small lipoprotein YifL/flagellar basal body rod protein FlgB